jgi:alkanesulfonate monooxygenase SsuD/methylene tetrahydromethanopterin reductase-like flavin-dependent oxidoreductase (luciferase family)
MAARHPSVKLGTMVVVLPWHDPVRVASQVSVLDTLSQGRVILGLGRGISKHEFDGFRVPMEESRERFVEAAEIVLEALETGVIRYDGKHYQIPERRLRPSPFASFRSRSYAAALSPESFEIMARLRLGMLIIAVKSWEVVGEDMERYRAAYQELNGAPPPAPLANAFVVCDKDGARAKETAYRYMENYWQSVIKHYEFTTQRYAGIKGYDQYAKMSSELQREGSDRVIEDFVDVQVWGTPSECLEKFVAIQELVGCETFLPVFAYGGIPVEDAERSMELFAREVMPALQALEPRLALR